MPEELPHANRSPVASSSYSLSSWVKQHGQVVGHKYRGWGTQVGTKQIGVDLTNLHEATKTIPKTWKVCGKCG